MLFRSVKKGPYGPLLCCYAHKDLIVVVNRCTDSLKVLDAMRLGATSCYCIPNVVHAPCIDELYVANAKLLIDIRLARANSTKPTRVNSRLNDRFRCSWCKISHSCILHIVLRIFVAI